MIIKMELGAKMKVEEPKPPREERTQQPEKYPRRNPCLGASYKEVARNGSGSQASAWVDVSDCMPKGDLDSWAKVVWTLKGSVSFVYLNQDLYLLEFVFADEAKWALKNGRRSFRGGMLHLE